MPRRKRGKSYAEVLVGHELPPAIPPRPDPVPSASTASTKAVQFLWYECEECHGSGYQPKMQTPSGLEYFMVCKVCRGRKGRIVRDVVPKST